jgi:hypothetical protein
MNWRRAYRRAREMIIDNNIKGLFLAQHLSLTAASAPLLYCSFRIEIVSFVACSSLLLIVDTVVPRGLVSSNA